MYQKPGDVSQDGGLRFRGTVGSSRGQIVNLGPGTELRSMGRQGLWPLLQLTELEGTRILHPGSKRNSVLAQTSSPRKKQVAMDDLG